MVGLGLQVYHQQLVGGDWLPWLDDMTFQKQLGMECGIIIIPTVTQSIIVQRGFHQPGMVSVGESTPIPLLCTPQRLNKNQLRLLRRHDCKIDCSDTPENCNRDIPSISWSLRVVFHKIVDHGQNIMLDHKFKHSEWPWDITRYHIDSVDGHHLH